MQNQIPIFNSSNDLEYIDGKKILGEGAFSEVVKVRNKNNNKFYALKKINLLKLSKADRDHLKNETSLHTSLDHKNIIKFITSLQEENMVYFLLEYATNGCLFFYIHSREGLPEKIALRYAYQTALAIKYLHDRNIIHRDIKPENILLDENFDVKICDFGWSCETEKGRARTTVCGTYEYMSPEIIFLSKHTNKVDIWCLGILLYEMLHGNPPFSAECMGDMKKEFSTKGIRINKNLSKDAKDLLKALLKRKEENRLTIDEVLDQPAFVNNLEEFKKPINKNEFEILVKNFLINTGGGRDRTIPDSILNKKNGSENIKSVEIPFYGENQSNPVVNNKKNQLGQFYLNDLRADNLNSTFGKEVVNQVKEIKVEKVKKDKEKINFKLGPIVNEKKETIKNEIQKTEKIKNINLVQQKPNKEIGVKKVLNVENEKINNKILISKNENLKTLNIKIESEKINLPQIKIEKEVKINKIPEKINLPQIKIEKEVKINKIPEKINKVQEKIKEEVKINKIPEKINKVQEKIKEVVIEKNENKIIVKETNITAKVENKNIRKINEPNKTINFSQKKIVVKNINNTTNKNFTETFNPKKIINKNIDKNDIKNINEKVINTKSNYYIQKKIVLQNNNKKESSKPLTKTIESNINKNSNLKEQKEKNVEQKIRKTIFKIDHFKDNSLNQNKTQKQGDLKNIEKIYPKINKVQTNNIARTIINEGNINIDKKILEEKKINNDQPKKIVYLSRYSSMKDLSRPNYQSNFTSSRNIQTVNKTKNYIDLYSSDILKKNKTSINKKKNLIRKITVKSRNSIISTNLNENDLNKKKNLVNPLQDKEIIEGKKIVLKESQNFDQKTNKNPPPKMTKNVKKYFTNIYQKDNNQRRNTDFSKKAYSSRLSFNNNFVEEKVNQKVESVLPFYRNYSTQSLIGVKRNNYEDNNFIYSNQISKFKNEYDTKNFNKKSESDSDMKINGLVVRRYRI